MPQEIIRHNIGRDINKAKATLSFGENLDELKTCPFHHGSPEALQKWHELKPALYVAQSFPSEKVINNALDQRINFPPFGLVDTKGNPVTEFDKDYPFEDLGEKMRSTLRTSLKETLKEASTTAGCPHLLSEGVSRAKQIMEYSKHAISDPYPSQTDLEVAIDGGIIGASLAMPRLLILIPELFEEPQDPEILGDTARASGQIPINFGDQHSAKFSAVFREVRIDETEFDERFGPACYAWHFNPDCFRLVPTKKGKLKAEVKPEVIEKAMESVEQIRIDNPDSHYEVGCPALRSLKKLWYWHVEIGRHIYKTNSKYNKNLLTRG